MRDSSTTGDRVRRLRKLRGMTQADLARAARLSLRTVKDIEQGAGGHRGETLHKLAVALQARTSALTGPGPELQPVPGEPWDDVRAALYQPPAGDGEPATPAGVLAALDGIRPDWEAARYSAARAHLPALIAGAMSLPADPAGRSARSTALSATAWLLNMTRQFEDAAVAARLAADAAPEMPDYLAAVSMTVWGLLRQGRAAEAAEIAVRHAGEAEPKFSRATTGELAGYGRMLLYVANAMATENRPGEAADALSLARAAASRLGRDVPFHPASTARFGPATVMVITAESAALTWQPGRVLAIADRARGSLAVIEPAQRLRHRLDVANAHAMRREYPDMVGVMAGLRAEAPEWLASQQYARDILEGVIRKRRGPWPEGLRELAVATRLPL
jgi:transcriptional regulator with XRE-family HTH domain